MEALCEIHFLETIGSQKIVEALQAKWRGAYPAQSLTDDKDVEVQVGPTGITVDQRAKGKRLMCRSSSNVDLVQIASSFMVVNRLAPYPGWNEMFKGTILSRFSEVSELVASKALRRIGLRYINKIDVPESPLVWEKWFGHRLPLPSQPESQIEQFHMEFQSKLNDADKMIIKLLTMPSGGSAKTSVILDLDVISEPAEMLKASEIEATLERMHGFHRLAFDSYMTRNVESLFSNATGS